MTGRHFAAVIIGRIMLSLAAFVGLGTVGAAASPGSVSAWQEIAGEYVVVAMRNTHVAAPLAAGPAEDLRGRGVRIEAGRLIMDGIDCAPWSISQPREDDVLSADSGLADLRLPALDGSVVNAVAFDMRCEGAKGITLYRADDRVLAMSWDNGSRYLILEKPLTPVVMTALQAQLRDMKFLGVPVTAGVLDDATLAALREYYRYRTGDPDAVVFARPAITANLLDGLRVLTPVK